MAITSTFYLFFLLLLIKLIVYLLCICFFFTCRPHANWLAYDIQFTLSIAKVNESKTENLMMYEMNVWERWKDKQKKVRKIYDKFFQMDSWWSSVIWCLSVKRSNLWGQFVFLNKARWTTYGDVSAETRKLFSLRKIHYRIN